MPVTQEQANGFKVAFDRLAANINSAILGKDHVVRLVLTCLLARGHVLLEDLPGVGKTSLAKALARTIAGSHSRIQFTPDMLPSDLTGVQTFDQTTGTFIFHRGPIFHSIVLADEINRASPKTQSALLEVMEEGQVTIDGKPESVGRPFMVIATQNPIEQGGTYPLPEAQLDRFLMRTSIDHPDHEAMVALMRDAGRTNRTETLQPVLRAEDVDPLSALADHVFVRDEVLSYVSQLATASRQHRHVKMGVSPRGGMGYMRCAKVWALSQGRTEVTPDDIRMLAKPVLNHRVLLTEEASFDGVTVDQVLSEIFHHVPVPQIRLY